MMRRAIPSPIPCLLLVIIAILGVGSRSVQAQTSRPVRYLVFSTYLGGSVPWVAGGSAHTFAQNAACDAQGNTYVTGATTVADLPVLNAWQPSPGAGSTMTAFVAKYDPTGKPLWCTYLGGNQQNMGVGVAAMPDGGVAVAGVTSANASGPFPTLNAYQGQNNGQSDYFVAVFDANGNLRYSTYLGGSGVEGTPGSVFTDDNSSGNNVAADAEGRVYVTGTTSSGSSGAVKFPVTANAIQSNLGGDADAFLCIIDPAQSGGDSLVYSSFLGGDKDDKGHSVAVEASGHQITVAGYTKSTNLHTTDNAYRKIAAPSGYISNGFVAQFRSSHPGSRSSRYTRHYVTYLGADASDARDDTYGMVLDPTGLILATGRTQSSDFPMTTGGEPSIFNTAPYLKAGTSNDEPYLVKIDTSLNGAASLVYATFLGGGAADGKWGSFCTSVGVDARGTVYVAGETNAPGQLYTPSSQPVESPQNFPYTQNALFPARQGSVDVIFMQIDPNGARLDYSTYLGGTKDDRAYGLAVDPRGNVVLSGLTFSANFPVKNAAQPWPGNTGSQNAFVTKFSAVGAPLGSFLLLLLAD
ncbi:MAG: hypothetical protein AB1424_07405 [Thermodesulfobacteriota bacterium]